MKRFQVIQLNFSLLGIVPVQSKCSREKMVMACSIYALATTSSVLFLVFDVKTFTEFVNNIYITSTAIMLNTFSTIIAMKSDKLFELISDGEKLVDERSIKPKMKLVYNKTGRQIEKWSKIGYFVIAKSTPFLWIFPKAIISYFRYFTTDLGNEAFELPLYFWFPFKWKTPIGYFIVVTFQYIAVLHFFMAVACVLSFGIAHFAFSMTMSSDVKNVLNSINECGKTKDNRSETFSHLSDFIKFYSQHKQYLRDFLDLYQPIFTMLSVWSLITICGVMLLIQMEMQGHDSGVVFVIISYALYAFGVVFVVFELGQRITNSFEEINDVTEIFEWYLYAHEMQKMLPIILIGTQKPIIFEFFGGIAASRETFRKIINKGYSYFMVIREFI